MSLGKHSEIETAERETSCKVDLTTATGRSGLCQCEAAGLGYHSQEMGADGKPTENKTGGSKSLLPSPGAVALEHLLLAQPHRQPAGQGERRVPEAHPQQHKSKGGRLGLKLRGNNFITDTPEWGRKVAKDFEQRGGRS